MSSKLPIVYHRLEQVVASLQCSEVGRSSEVYQLLKVSSTGANGVLDPTSFATRVRPVSVVKPKMPIINIEGLDGSGKTKVSTALVNTMSLEVHHTPPKRIKFLKDFFDEQEEPIRRAYYSLGNYLAAQDIRLSHFRNGVVIDRFWPSTSCYAAAHNSISTENGGRLPESVFEWPSDLLRPNLILFLVVSEEVRKYRHAYRNTTNTKEEQLLANNTVFRNTLIESYKRIQGPPLRVIDANEDIQIVQDKVCKMMLETFPILASSNETSRATTVA